MIEDVTNNREFLVRIAGLAVREKNHGYKITILERLYNTLRRPLLIEASLRDPSMRRIRTISQVTIVMLTSVVIEAAEYAASDFTTVIEDHVFTSTLQLQGALHNRTLVRNCTFVGIQGDGILLRNVEDVVITGCTFSDIHGQAAIRLSISGSTKNVTIDGNHIRNVQQNGINAGQRSGDGVDHKSLRIIGNLIENSGLGSGYTGLTHHIYVQTQDILVEGNRLLGTRDGNAISIRSSGIVRGNTISGHSIGGGKSAIRYYSDHRRGDSNLLLVENNMVDNCAGSSELITIFNPASHYNGETGHIVERFVIRFNTSVSTQALRSPILIGEDYRHGPYHVSVYGNLLVSTQGAPAISGPTHVSTANITTTNLDLFRSGSDFHLLEGHPAIRGAGEAPEVPPQDIDGDARPTSDPDAGADQAQVFSTPVIITPAPAVLSTLEDVVGNLVLMASYSNGDVLTWSVLTPGGKGVASVNGIGTTTLVTYAPNMDENGSDSFVVQVSDGNGGTDEITVSVTIAPVNDAPSFVRGADQTVLQNSEERTVAGWATAIGAGPANESGQSLAFLVTADMPELFSVQPTVSSTGTLTFTPAADAYGTTTVSVNLCDNGGTANGGVDQSATNPFRISIVLATTSAISRASGASSCGVGSMAALALGLLPLVGGRHRRFAF